MPRYTRLCHACRQFAAGLPPKKGGGKQLHPLFILLRIFITQPERYN